MIVGFMGNDGSGKTTVIKLLEKKLINRGLQTIYVPGYEHLFLNSVKNYYQKVTGKSINNLQNEYDDTLRSKTYKLFYLWPYFVLIDYVCLILKYWLKPGRIVLFDRYAYDYVISFKYLGVCTVFAKYLFLSLPKPRSCFILDTAPEIAYERKKHDHKGSIEYYRTQRQQYLWLSKKKKIPVINTDRFTPDEIAKKILDQLL